MPPRFVGTRVGALLRRHAFSRSHPMTRRTLVAAPRAGDGPLMERRPDRELPEIQQPGMRWARTVPIFLAILASSTLAIFNYQKSSSPVVASTLYALRTSPRARDCLGDEIYFAHRMPWIWGRMNQLHGRIDIRFEVAGSRGRGTMRFRSAREGRRGVWGTQEWSLEMRGPAAEGGRIDLLDDADPFQGIELDDEEVKVVGRGSYSPSTSS